MRLVDVGPFDDTTIEFPKGTNPELADVYLLVGENGTGKSTVLQGIADMLSCSLIGGSGLTSRRLRNGSATIHLNAFGSRLSIEHQMTPDASMLGHLGSFLVVNRRSSGSYDFHFNAAQFPAKRTQFNWIAASYTGRIEPNAEIKIEGIREITNSPFEDILSFERKAMPQLIGQYLVNQNYKRLKALSHNNQSAALESEKFMHGVELAIQEILATPFQFVFNDEDENIRMQSGSDITEFALLPDGVKSIMSWMADLLMRLERIPWENNTPVFKRSFLLLLDEIDIHLHPRWQRKILPVLQKLFPNAQIIASTHSPFVVASLKDGAVIELKRNEKGGITAVNRSPEELKLSYSATIAEVFGIESDFPIEVEEKYNEFKLLRDSFAKTHDKESLAKLEAMAKSLAEHGEEMSIRIGHEMRQLRK
jgi:predicted ATP-binding protein involved in virulence